MKLLISRIRLCDYYLDIVFKVLPGNNVMINLDGGVHCYTKHSLLVENTHQIICSLKCWGRVDHPLS